ncbi:hypothetical protein TWF481_006084 [Arthrobotrys musiformis]|uniref:F-box domain-containing protein n=2 Tax=Arthrobotrys musiformis TaxID=47236 RepID=A0AAV9WFL7_9PEZI
MSNRRLLADIVYSIVDYLPNEDLRAFRLVSRFTNEICVPKVYSTIIARLRDDGSWEENSKNLIESLLSNGYGRYVKDFSVIPSTDFVVELPPFAVNPAASTTISLVTAMGSIRSFVWFSSLKLGSESMECLLRSTTLTSLDIFGSRSITSIESLDLHWSTNLTALRVRCMSSINDLNMVRKLVSASPKLRQLHFDLHFACIPTFLDGYASDPLAYILSDQSRVNQGREEKLKLSELSVAWLRLTDHSFYWFDFIEATYLECLTIRQCSPSEGFWRNLALKKPPLKKLEIDGKGVTSGFQEFLQGLDVLEEFSIIGSGELKNGSTRETFSWKDLLGNWKSLKTVSILASSPGCFITPVDLLAALSAGGADHLENLTILIDYADWVRF